MPSRILLILLLLTLTTAPLYAANQATAPGKGAISRKTVSKPIAKPVPAPILKDFTFRGNQMGDPAEAVIERIFAQPNEDRFSEQDKSDCLQALKEQGESTCDDAYPKIAPYAKIFIQYRFFNKKLSGFTLFFPLEAYNQIETMLISKYGDFHTVKMKTVQNQMGAEFNQILSTWNTAHGPLQLYFCYPDLVSGVLRLDDQKALQEAQKLKQQQLQEQGKVVF